MKIIEYETHGEWTITPCPYRGHSEEKGVKVVYISCQECEYNKGFDEQKKEVCCSAAMKTKTYTKISQTML